MKVKKIAGRSGTYILLKQIGKGGMGSVWSANWISEHGGVIKPVAVKLLHGLALTEEDREQVLKEARILAQLNHTGIVSMFDVGEWNGQLFLVMEWIDGVDLRQFLHKLKKARHRLEFVVCCYILGQLLKAIRHAHERKVDDVPAPILHSDIKPENILISSSGGVKLTDFGIARLAAASERTLSRPLGTLRHMSPEQLFGRVRIETDIYAAGTVGYELLHWPNHWLGHVPRERLHVTVASGYLPELGGPGIDPWMVDHLRQMLATRPEDRYTAYDAWSNIFEKTTNYHHGEKRLEELYLKVIGGTRSGWTGILGLNLEEFGVDLSAVRQTPMPALSDDFGSEFNATPDEPTTAEPRPHERADEDSPIVIRRERNRVTPTDGGADPQSNVHQGPADARCVPPARGDEIACWARGVYLHDRADRADGGAAAHLSRRRSPAALGHATQGRPPRGADLAVPRWPPCADR